MGGLDGPESKMDRHHQVLKGGFGDSFDGLLSYDINTACPS
jgi:hypothetical protein